MRLPAGWLIAGMLGAATVALVSRRELNPPAKAMSAAQGVIGVVAVEPLTRLTGSDLVHFAGCAAFSVSITLGLSVVFGIVLARFAKDLGLATANLSLIAGGASTISCMARELGADERYVALSQYLRLTIVVLTMPLVLSQLGTADPTPRLVLAQDHWSGSGLLVLVVVIYAGARLARLARMPAPFLLGPLVVGAVVAIADPSLARLMDPDRRGDRRRLCGDRLAGRRRLRRRHPAQVHQADPAHADVHRPDDRKLFRRGRRRQRMDRGVAGRCVPGHHAGGHIRCAWPSPTRCTRDRSWSPCRCCGW